MSTSIASKKPTLFSSASVTASTTGDGTTTTAQLQGIDRYTSALFYLKCGTVTGTSPTMNVYIQTQLPDNSTWTDLVSFTQITSSNTSQVASLVNATISPYAATDATLAAGTTKAVHLGCCWRVKIVIGGTNPAFANVALYALLV